MGRGPLGLGIVVVLMPVVRLGSVTGETYYAGVGNFEGFAGPRGAVIGPRGYLARLAQRANVALPPLDDVDESAPVSAHLNADRWLVGCPDCGRDFQIAWRTVPLYMCPACWNAAADGRWRRVAWPPDPEAIERAVAGVPREQRNWMPGWSVERALLEAGTDRPVGPAEYRAAIGGR